MKTRKYQYYLNLNNFYKSMTLNLCMKRFYKKKNLDEKKLAGERVTTLFTEAEKAFPEDPALANRYVELARKVAMKVRLRLSSAIKKRFCKHCYCFLVPGKNCRVRTRRGILVYYCRQCKKYMRFPYKPKKKTDALPTHSVSQKT